LTVPVQRFLSTHDQVANVFPRRRDHDTAANLDRQRMAEQLVDSETGEIVDWCA
jgi:hypothetical protein